MCIRDSRRRDGEHAERRTVEGRAQLGLRDAARAALAQLAFAETQHVVVAAERERRGQRRHEAAALAVVEGVEQTGVDDRREAPPEPLEGEGVVDEELGLCLLYTSPSPRDRTRSRMPSSA